MEIKGVLNDWKQIEERLLAFNAFERLTYFTRRGFFLPEKVEENAVCFVGINPSFRKGDKCHNGLEFYPFDSAGLYDDKVFKDEIQYFRQMHQLVKKWMTAWSHIDIFCLRETDQKKVVALFGTQEGIDFLRIQAEIFRKILETAKPRVIVVCNALARDVLNYPNDNGLPLGFEYKYEFRNKLGTPVIISEGPLKETPVFFSSMLSGQRALDRGSFERLSWHIQFVLNKKQVRPLP